uniref:Protein FAR1-related sequence 5-like n=1 Tax=Tanacetum cinerariifolium TaxID=118510 RepID=A0A699L8E6_TANCI|nr:protein FAR1-related sequence 5-like [Tanacetum cinerariifolium]
MLNEFVIQFDKAVNTRIAAKEDEDFMTMKSRPVLSSIHPIKAKAGEGYTKKIFELFQKEWIEATTNLTHETKSKSEEKSSY